MGQSQTGKSAHCRKPRCLATLALEYTQGIVSNRVSGLAIGLLQCSMHLMWTRPGSTGKNAG
jgi:hypothetical protein